MSYNGFEIFFQNLGNADSIFVRFWADSVPTNILIDGGWKTSAPQVETFLAERARESGDPTIHHLVCTHSDDDHAGGLVKLVESANFPIEQAWVHDTRSDHQVLSPLRLATMQLADTKRLLKRIQASEATRHSLLDALSERGIPVASPFAGASIGPLVVVGPTETFFDDQFSKLSDTLAIKEMEARFAQREANQLMESLLGTTYLEKADDASKPLGGGVTTPANEVSTVLALPWKDNGVEGIYLFTGDVGREGLSDVIERVGEHLQNLPWMDVPHHGSRRSMTQEMVDHFAPKMAFISCDGSRKHPSKKLVNALKAHGGVYSTHYSVNATSWLRHKVGTVYPVSTVPATPLYEKK